MNTERIKPDQNVHAKAAGSIGVSSGVRVGAVDHLEGQRWIKLKKGDAADGKHHWIPVDWVERADDRNIYLNKTKDEFNREMRNELPTDLN